MGTPCVSDLTGAWKLVSYKVISKFDGVEVEVGAEGRLVYTTDGFVSVLINLIDEKMPNPRAVISYIGTVSFLDNLVIHNIEIASISEYPKVQRREYEFMSRFLSLKTVDRKLDIHVVIWERFTLESSANVGVKHG